MEQRSQELDWDMHMLCMHFHSLPSYCRARLRSSKSGWCHQSDRNDPKGQGTPCGHCWHRVRARIPRAFKCWWPPSSAHWFFSVSLSTSLCASMVCVLATHQIWTNGYHHRLRAYALWLHMCISQVIWINPSAGCLSCEHSFPPLAYKAPSSWWSLIKTKKIIFFNLRLFIKE